MADQTLNESTFLRSLSDLTTDFADLFQKELRLAKAEIAANISKKLQAGLWMSIAALLGLLAALLLIQALVFALISWGLAPYWACLLVAIVLGGAGAVSFSKGRADAAEGLTPERTISQIKEDIKSTKEQLV